MDDNATELMQGVETDIESYYCINIAIHFIDHIRMQIAEHFDAMNKKAVQLLAVVPSVISKEVSSTLLTNLKTNISMYKDDLPAPELVDAEITHWKMSYKNRLDCPKTLASAMKDCDSDLYPNIARHIMPI